MSVDSPRGGGLKTMAMAVICGGIIWAMMLAFMLSGCIASVSRRVINDIVPAARR